MLYRNLLQKTKTMKIKFHNKLYLFHYPKPFFRSLQKETFQLKNSKNKSFIIFVMKLPFSLSKSIQCHFINPYLTLAIHQQGTKSLLINAFLVNDKNEKF